MIPAAVACDSRTDARAKVDHPWPRRVCRQSDAPAVFALIGRRRWAAYRLRCNSRSLPVDRLRMLTAPSNVAAQCTNGSKLSGAGETNRSSAKTSGRSMTLQSHSTEAVNRFPVNCIMGTHPIRCQESRFEDEILGGAGRTIPEFMSFIFCRLRRSETGVGNSRCLIPGMDSNHD